MPEQSPLARFEEELQTPFDVVNQIVSKLRKVVSEASDVLEPGQLVLLNGRSAGCASLTDLRGPVLAVHSWRYVQKLALVALAARIESVAMPTLTASCKQWGHKTEQF
jgi:hypothetical protein